MSPLKSSRVPAYFGAFLHAVSQGARIDHVHLGHWDEPQAATDDPRDFEAAQNRMAEKLIRLSNLKPGQLVLDVGCGLGGLARCIDAYLMPIHFIGLNIDPRQLAICKQIAVRPESQFDWIAADACTLPVADALIDHVFCIEAIFHFERRLQFLKEAFRVLKPGGMLVLSDILLERPGSDFALSMDEMELCLETELGPWPQKWCSLAELRDCCAETGFFVEIEIDATANTLPSYRTIAPAVNSQLTGPMVMRLLHESGHLKYVYLRLAKAPTSSSHAARDMDLGTLAGRL